MSTINYIGKGRVTCPQCGGDKKVKCEKCKGHGEFKNCNECDSTGEVNCPDCGGSGKATSICPVCVNGYVYKTRWINCAGCHGMGRRREIKGINRGEIVSCWECGGRGQVKETYKDICPNCHGEYERETNKPCNKCGGTGKTKCSKCDGTGHAKCKACEGTGKTKCSKCNGEGAIAVDSATTLRLMETAAIDGNFAALHDLAIAYIFGTDGLSVNYDKAEECFRKLIKRVNEASETDEGADCYSDSAEAHLRFLPEIRKGNVNAMRELAKWFSEDALEERGMDCTPRIEGCEPEEFWIDKAAKAEKSAKTATAMKSTPKSSPGPARSSTKKRWKFVVLGLLFGFLGLHLAYAKRWFLFVLLWAGFITGGMFYKGSAAEKTSDGVIQQVQQSEQERSNDDMIGGIGFGVWALLWIGGTLFIKKDGKGNRM